MRHQAPLLLSLSLCLFHGPLAGAASRLSVTSAVGKACGQSLPAAALQQDLEAQLHGAGIATSRVHNAGLSADFECVPVESNAAAGSLAVHQCLSLAQVVSVPATSSGMKLATTWRNCQQYTCRGSSCATFARTGQRSLFDEFLTAYRDLNATREAPPSPVQTASIGPTFHVEVSRPVYVFSLVFYLVYILTCLMLLVRWTLAR